jgi:hypothetical protein
MEQVADSAALAVIEAVPVLIKSGWATEGTVEVTNRAPARVAVTLTPLDCSGEAKRIQSEAGPNTWLADGVAANA